MKFQYVILITILFGLLFYYGLRLVKRNVKVSGIAWVYIIRVILLIVMLIALFDMNSRGFLQN